MQFLAVYANLEKVNLQFKSMPCTLYNIYQEAQRQRRATGRRDSKEQGLLSQGTGQLISAFRAQGVFVYSLEEGKECQVVGRKSARLKGFLLVQKQSRPPKLKIVERIRNRSLNKLDKLIVELARDYSGDASGEGEGEVVNKGVGKGVGVGVSAKELGVGARELGVGNNSAGEVESRLHALPRRRAREVANRGGTNWDNEGVSRSATGTSSGSLFVPSNSGSQNNQQLDNQF